MNSVKLTGNLTRDPEARTVTINGKTTTVVRFGLAVSRHFKKSDGNPGSDVDFFNLEAWDRGAETIAKYFHKGSPILVEGTLRNHRWKDAENNNRSEVVVRVEQFEFFTRKKDEDSGTKPEAEAQPVAAGGEPEEGGDIPF